VIGEALVDIEATCASRAFIALPPHVTLAQAHVGDWANRGPFSIARGTSAKGPVAESNVEVDSPFEMGRIEEQVKVVASPATSEPFVLRWPSMALV